ncbi:MAG TPA: hypothetical protein VKA78_07960, partial [Pyrinomonadaceae bacterium]|nr:hypothetical protein [Pyrinomonadaceae bacterium]
SLLLTARISRHYHRQRFGGSSEMCGIDLPAKRDLDCGLFERCKRRSTSSGTDVNIYNNFKFPS